MITKAEITLLSLMSNPNEEYEHSYNDYYEQKTSSSQDSYAFSDNHDHELIINEPIDDVTDKSEYNHDFYEDKLLLICGYLRTSKCINAQKQSLDPIDIIPIITTYIDNVTLSIESFLDEMFTETKINDIISSIVQETSQETSANIQYVYTQKLNEKLKPKTCDDECYDDYKEKDEITSPHHYHRGQYHKEFNDNLEYDPYQTVPYPSPSPDFVVSGYQENDQEIYSTSPEFPEFINNYSYSPMSYNNTPMPTIFPFNNQPYPYHYDTSPTQTPVSTIPFEFDDRKQKDEFINVDDIDIDDIIRTNPSLEELAVNHLIPRFMTDIAGSRYIQHLLKAKRHPTKYVNFVLNALVASGTNLAELSLNPFANYTISLLFELADDIQLKFMLEAFIADNPGNNNNNNNQAKPHLLSRLCLSKFGCRVIQTMIRCIKNDSDLITEFIVNFEKYTKDYLHKFLVDRNGNHVIKVLVDLQLPYKYIKSINDVVNNDLGILSIHNILVLSYNINTTYYDHEYVYIYT